MTTADSVHQCPRCDLRFAFRTELEDHLRADHPGPIADDTIRTETAGRADGHELVP
jgi:hypothetical protein